VEPPASKTSHASHSSPPKSRGLKQSWRALWLGIAFFLFAATTYWAFFDPQFESKSWWLHPIEFNISSRLNRIEPGVDFTCISALPGGQEIWVGGSKGMILHSRDGGSRWEQLPMTVAQGSPPASSVTPSASPSKSPSSRSKASLFDPLNTRTRSVASLKGNEWMRVMGEAPKAETNPTLQIQTTPYATPRLTPLVASPSPALAAALSPFPTATEQSSASSNEQAQVLSNKILDLQFVSPKLGYALSDGGLFTTLNAGQTWRFLSENSLRVVGLHLKFIDEKRGALAGLFGITFTNDGGETWSDPGTWERAVVEDIVLNDGLKGLAVTPRQVLEFTQGDTGAAAVIEVAPVPENQTALRITKLPEGPVFLCGENGFVARSVNGKEFRTLGTRATAKLNGISFASGQNGWAVGNGGTIIATKNGGNSWDNQSSGDKDLTAVYFSSASAGLVAGANGALLGTNDGGQNWSSLVVVGSAKSGSSHRWIPAPFYLFSLLLFFGLIRMTPPEIAPPPVEGIGGLLVSDKPIGPEDPDYLGFQKVALGLSNYLRNNATNPPLTVAITGEWGMGKSSLMNLLDADLRSYKFRPVWFNAWHHQTEEHLLAALLENVRTQAIPSIFSPEGIVFRAKLLWLRARSNLLAFLLVIAAVSFCVSYFAHDPNRLSESPERLRAFLKEPGKKIIDSINPNSEGSKALLVLISAVGSLVTFLKAFRAFGVDPASLLASSSKAAKPSELRAQTSFRYNFSNEFRDVADSLNPLTMVLFVDDLDRCRPEQVYDMLEAVNFLVSCGDCFVVMGLARRRVERCIGLVFDKVAAEGPDQDKGKHLNRQQQRQRFARAYLEKLINIEVPVPKAGLADNLSLLIRKAAKKPRRKTIETVGETISNLRKHLVPIALALFAVMLAIWASAQIFDRPGQSPATAPSPTPSPTPTEQSSPSPSLAPGVSPIPTPQPSPDSPTGPAKFWPGQAGSRPLWAMLLLAAAIITPGLIRLSRRTGAVIEDSPGFIQALEKWFPFLATGNDDMTPRTVKRFVNRVRYFAMMKGSFRPAPRWWQLLADFFQLKSDAPAAISLQSTRKEVLVALATIYKQYPSWFSGDLASFLIELESERTKKDHGLPEFNPSDLTAEVYKEFITSREDLLVALATIHEKHPGWFSGNRASFIQELKSEGAKKDHGLPDFNPSDMTAEVYEDFKTLVAGVEVR
jgi:photosystem II stability/assembly factor-like uncharacterized protein